MKSAQQNRVLESPGTGYRNQVANDGFYLLNHLLLSNSICNMTTWNKIGRRTATQKEVYFISLAIVALLASCGGQSPSQAFPEPSEPRSGIVFTSDRTDNWDIFFIQADGSGLSQLTDFPGVDADPDWSPDGRMIAFRSRQDGSSDIFVMGSDGSNPINLIGDADTSLDDEFAPQWNPDGKKFSLYTDRYPSRGNCIGGYHQIALLVQETGNYAIDLFDTIAGEQYSSTWSPDGRYLVFDSTCRIPGFQLYSFDTQTGDTKKITNEPISHTHPAWSHDGRFLAFAKYVGSNNEIFILDLNTSQQIQITNHPANDIMPSWSPDDSQIAFVSNREGNKEIFIMNADGSGVYNLTNHPADDWYPSWSPVMFNP